MKTAISIPDHIFHAVEQTARKMGISRSELFTRAAREFVETVRGSQITELLNEVYKDESSGPDPDLFRMQASVLSREEW